MKSGQDRLKGYYWVGKGGLHNYGDELNVLLAKLLNVDIEWTTPDQANLVVIGSILEHLPKNWTGTVCGAGLLRPESRIDLSHANVLAVRGKLTAERVTGLPDSVVLGDPGLLAPKVNPEQPAFYDVGVLPHWSDTDLTQRYGYGHIINPTDVPSHVIAEITRCKRLITSSLHGAIIADAYGIPRQIELFPNAHREGGDFKYRDYASVFDEEPHFDEMWKVDSYKVEQVQDRLCVALLEALGLPPPLVFPKPQETPQTGPAPQISLLVPFRGGGEHRERVWEWLRRYWEHHLPSAEIVMGWDGGTPFSKSSAVNYAAKRARGRIFVILDADAFMDWQELQDCADKIDAALAKGKRMWLMPYSCLHRLNEATAVRLLNTDPENPQELLSMKTRPPEDWLESGSPNSEFYGHQFGAMCQVMPREAFEMVGGMDFRFAGWGCTDVQTEILTMQGWKTYQDVGVGDPVLTLNHETGLSEWKPIQKMNVYSDGPFKMMAIKSTNHSSFTTMDHRWPVIARNGDRIWRTTETLNTHDRIPISAKCADLPSQPIYDDALVELVAWFFTEGWLKPSKRSVGIKQSHVVHPEYCDQIELALTRAFGEPSRGVRGVSAAPPAIDSDPVELSELVAQYGICRETIQFWCRSGKISAVKVPRGGKYGTWLVDRHDAEAFIQKWRIPSWWRCDGERDATFNLNPEAGDILLHLAPDKVPSFEFLISLTQHQLDLFIGIAMKGDGCTRVQGSNRKPTRVFEQRDRRAAEAFAFAVILSGRGVSIRPRNQNAKGDRSSGTPRELNYAMTVVHIRHRDQISLITPSGYAHSGNRQYEIVNYDGLVWCPTTENGTWLARRKGSVYWTGNSEDASILRAVDTLYAQHELAHNTLLHFWHAHKGLGWKTREWEGQVAPGVAKPHLAKRYGQATGEPAFMRSLIDEHFRPEDDEPLEVRLPDQKKTRSLDSGPDDA